MNLREFQDAEEFLERVEGFLLKNESVNNLALGILYAHIKRIEMKEIMEPFSSG